MKTAYESYKNAKYWHAHCIRMARTCVYLNAKVTWIAHAAVWRHSVAVWKYWYHHDTTKEV